MVERETTSTSTPVGSNTRRTQLSSRPTIVLARTLRTERGARSSALWRRPNEMVWTRARTATMATPAPSNTENVRLRLRLTSWWPSLKETFDASAA